MSEKLIYLVFDEGEGNYKKTRWRMAGRGYECHDGSINIKLDMFPQLVFNVRSPKSNGERQDANGDVPRDVPRPRDDENRDKSIPF